MLLLYSILAKVASHVLIKDLKQQTKQGFTPFDDENLTLQFNKVQFINIYRVQNNSFVWVGHVNDSSVNWLLVLFQLF